MAMKQLYINGTGSGNFEVYISSDTYLDSPTLDLNEYSVPAVNGNIINYNKRLNNVVRKIDCFIKSDPINNLTQFKKLIYANTGYMRIESDYDPDTYQHGYLAQEIKVTPFNTGAKLEITFSLYFSCKPQKWFKVNTTASGSTIQPHCVEMQGVIAKNDTRPYFNMKKVLEMLPVDVQPTCNYYVQFELDGLASQEVTDVSVTTNTSDIVIVCGVCRTGYEGNYQYQDYVICYGNGSANISSYDLPDGRNSIKVVVPASGVLQVSASAVTSNGTKTFEWDAADYSLSIANTSAIGMDMDYSILYNFVREGASLLYTPILVQSKLNGVVQNEQTITVHFEKLDAETRQYIYDNYADSYAIMVEIDSNNTAKIVKGTDSMDISSYLEVDGNIDGMCDSVIVVPYVMANSVGTVKKIELLKPRWWQL